MSDKSLTEKLVSTLNIYNGGVYNLRKDTVILPNGNIIDRDIVEHPGAVAIIPIVNNKLVLIRQFRQAAGKVLYEIPAGTLRRGEDPEQCALRELEEETGYFAGSFKMLLHCYLAPGYSTEIITFYLATNLKLVGSKNEQDEFIKVFTVTKKKALQMIKKNEIEDAKTICGILTYYNNS